MAAFGGGGDGGGGVETEQLSMQSPGGFKGAPGMVIRTETTDWPLYLNKCSPFIKNDPASARHEPKCRVAREVTSAPWTGVDIGEPKTEFGGRNTATRAKSEGPSERQLQDLLRAADTMTGSPRGEESPRVMGYNGFAGVTNIGREFIRGKGKVNPCRAENKMSFGKRSFYYTSSTWSQMNSHAFNTAVSDSRHYGDPEFKKKEAHRFFKDAGGRPDARLNMGSHPPERTRTFLTKCLGDHSNVVIGPKEIDDHVKEVGAQVQAHAPTKAELHNLYAGAAGHALDEFAGVLADIGVLPCSPPSTRGKSMQLLEADGNGEVAGKHRRPEIDRGVGIEVSSGTRLNAFRTPSTTSHKNIIQHQEHRGTAPPSECNSSNKAVQYEAKNNYEGAAGMQSASPSVVKALQRLQQQRENPTASSTPRLERWSTVSSKSPRPPTPR
jgi:hypothetical protein